MTLTVDEFIVPRNKNIITLNDLIKQLDPLHSFSGYEFRNIYFFMDFNVTSVKNYEDHIQREARKTTQMADDSENSTDQFAKIDARSIPLYRIFTHAHSSKLTVTSRYLSHVDPSPEGYSPKS